MRLLSLDTATEACSVAVLSESEVFAMFEEVQRGHAERILALIDAVLLSAHCDLTMLDGIVASVGPGSFTGVRIGVSVAQGLAFGAGLPVIAVSTLEALAAQAIRAGAEQVMACLDARMGEVYWGCFRADANRGLVACGAPHVGAPELVSASFSGPFHGIGRGFRAFPLLGQLPGIAVDVAAREALPRAADMVRLGATRLAAGEGRDPADLQPVYLRDKVALTEMERAAHRGVP